MNFNDLESSELLEIYNKIEAFIDFLNKEVKNAEKLGEANE